MYGIIYSAMSPDARIYVGQTTQKFEARKSSHIYQSKKPEYYFHRALAKYGAHLFIWKIEKECETKEELNQAEEFYMNYYNSRDPECGFNIKEAGSRGKHTEETKKKISAIKIGKKMSPLSEQHKKKISERTIGSNNPFYGKKHSEETKMKLRMINTGKIKSEETKAKLKGRAGCKGRKNGNSKLSEEQVYQIREAIGTTREIADRYEINYELVRRICKRERWKHLPERNNK